MGETAGLRIEEQSFSTKEKNYGSETENPYFLSIAEYVDKRRQELGITTPEGDLDVEKKLESSSYEILSRSYYRENILHRGMIPSTTLEEYPTDEEYRESLIMHTQQLISQIAKHQPDALFFLDKSARPVAWMIKKLWPLFVEDETIKFPDIKFIDVDVNRIFGKTPSAPRPTLEEIYGWNPDQQQINKIRSIYSRNGRRVERHPDSYSTAWVVDEISISNGSAMVSQKLLEDAFPDLKVESKIWMPSKKTTVSSGASYPTQLPPWYNKDYTEGRGVSEAGTNSFLSGRRSPDILSQALRTDIDLLAKDIKEGRQSIRPLQGCFEINPVTGEEDRSRPKYKIAKFIKGKRVVTEPAKN